MFHVKHPRPSLPDAEIAEDHIEDIFDIDSASESAQRGGRQAQLFGDDSLTATLAFGNVVVICSCLIKAHAMFANIALR